MLKVIGVIFAILIAVPTLALAEINPTKVSSMEVQVDQDVFLSLQGVVKSLEVRLMIPQEDAFQKVTSMEVSVPHEIVTDEYGNRMVKVVFDKPGPSPSFHVKSTVSISRRDSASLPQIAAFTQPTTLIQSDDREIIRMAEVVTAGETGGFEKTAAVTGWVNENVEYDLAYAEINLSAKKVLQQKSGVCDEYSALTMAMLRSIGYRTGYIVGYAYGRGYRLAEAFVPHGWVEVCAAEGCYPSDPTWGEAGWLDAAHVKFATLPESYYVEATASATGTGQISVKLESIETKIDILSSKEEPLITSAVRLLDEDVWNGYAVLRADLEAPGCVLTKVLYGSCLQEEGKPFLTPEKNESVLYFCGKKTVFMPFKIPEDLRGGTVYTCALTAAPSAGEHEEVEVTLNPMEKVTETTDLSVDRTTVRPGETVTATAPGAEIFTDYGTYGAGQVTMTAPAKSFMIYAYKNGSLSFRSVTVTETRPLDIMLTAQEEAVLGEEIEVSVEVKNIGATSRDVSVSFAGEAQSKEISAGETETFVFSFAPTENDKLIQVFVETRGFSTSSSKSLNVIGPEKNILDQIIEAITDFLNSIFGV